MKQLRDYQEVACDYICQGLNNYKRPFIYCMACGAGKSLVISELAKRIGKVLVLTLSVELCAQDYEEMVEQGVAASVYSASMNSKEVGDITIATIMSAYKHPELFTNADVVIIDEVQAVNPADPKTTFMKLLIEMNKAKTVDEKRIKVVGLTATAWRNITKVIPKGRFYQTTTMIQPLNRIPCRGGFLWSSIVEGLTTKKAMEMGYLTPVEYYSSPIEGKLVVNSTGADYTEESLDVWGENAVSRCLSVMKGAEEKWNIKSGIVALPFIRHAEALQALCEKEGLSTTIVHSKTPQKARKEAIKAFKNGEIRWLVQCGIANVGFNSPITDTLVWCRPCLSLNLWCLSEDTEVLTADGWKKYDEIKEGDAIPNLNLETGKGEWDTVKTKIKRPLSSDEYWVEYDSPYSKFKVTNKHRMVARRTVGNGRKTGWAIYNAEELLERQPWQVPTAVNIDQPGVPLSDDDLWIIGMLMTDGSWEKGKNGRIQGNLTISQTDKYPEIMEEIETRLDKVGLKWKKRLVTPKGKVQNIIRGNQVIARHNGYVYHLYIDAKERYYGFLSKDLSPLLMAMNKHQLMCVLSGMWAGNGIKHSNVDYVPRTAQIVTARKECAEKLQKLCAINGLHCFLHTENKNRNTPVYYISVKDQPWKSIGTPLCKGSNRPRVKRTDGGGMCWCVEASKNGTIITRYKGHVMVMGNCQSCGRVMRLSEGKSVARVLDLAGTLETFGRPEAVHIGKEQSYKTIIVGENNKKLSGVPLRSFRFVRNKKQEKKVDKEKQV